MKKPTQYKFYYFLFTLCLIGAGVNFYNGSTAVFWFWVGVFVVLYLFFRRSRTLHKNLQLEQDKKDALRSAQVIAFKQPYLDFLKLPETTELSSVNLEPLALTYGLDAAASELIGEDARRAIENDLVRDSLADGVLSPDNYALIQSTAARLELKMDLSAETIEGLEKMKHFWEIENGELTELDVPISLPAGEHCYFQSACRWLELRTTTRSVGYSGVTASFKLAKGVRYRMGAFKPRRVSTDTMTEIDTGTLYVTDKRLIFMGVHKNTNIRLDVILSFIPYSDGIEIGKDSGISPVLICGHSDDLAHLLTRLKA